MKLIDVLTLAAIVANAFVATAGSIGYGCANNEHLYTVVGVLNFIGWAYIGYRWVKER